MADLIDNTDKTEETNGDGSVYPECDSQGIFSDIADKLLRHINNGIDTGEIELSVKTYKDITGALKNLRDIKNIKSNLDIQEQVAKINKLKNDIAEETTDNSLNVVISDELKEYCD